LPDTINVTGKDTHSAAIEAYEKIINQNAADGWELFSTDYIKSRQNPGCLGFLAGNKGETVEFKLLIYRKAKS
jgi:hypothetical protein